MSTTDFHMTVEDCRLHGIESHGTGLPLLMLHGSGSSSTIFHHQFSSPLADRHRLIAIDLPGHGRSANAVSPARDYTITGLARVVGAVLDGLGVQDVAVLGWSLGGHVAIEMASSRSGIKGMTLVGTPPLGRGPLATLRAFHPRWDMLLASRPEFNGREAQRFLRLCHGVHATDADMADLLRCDGEIRRYFLASMMRGAGADQHRVVERFTGPIALINGEEDHTLRQSYLESLELPWLWSGKSHRLDGAGHAAFRDQPERFNQLLAAFLVDLERHLAAQARRDIRRA